VNSNSSNLLVAIKSIKGANAALLNNWYPHNHQAFIAFQEEKKASCCNSFIVVHKEMVFYDQIEQISRFIFHAWV